MWKKTFCLVTIWLQFIKNDMALKTHVIRLHNLISVNIFFTIKDHSFSLQLSRERTNQLKKPFKTQTYLNPISMNIFVTVKDVVLNCNCKKTLESK